MSDERMAMATQERTELADFVADLAAEQWDAPSLCTGWTVRDVVAHVVSYDGLSQARSLRRLARARFSPAAANRIGIDEQPRDPAALVALLRANLRPTGLPAGFGGMIALVDGMIHHQDIRRPLDAPREIPPDRLRVTLRLALLAPPIRAFWRARRLTLVATDLDWRHGSGPELRGPGEALLMAVAGRSAALAELSGPGLPVLTGRM